jgi:4-amino-4-deoxychorismate lyase
MLWDGRTCPRLALHRARLTRSASALGWPAPGHLGRALGGLPTHSLRLRVTMAASGKLTLEKSPLPPPKPEWRVAVAPQRLVSRDPWLQIKATRRSLYDAARAALTAGLDEVLFLNERGEVCEGTITNLFFDRGQGLRTPPLTSGLLPGVLRAELSPPEEVLLAVDLSHVRLWLGNALRGLIPARLI